MKFSRILKVLISLIIVSGCRAEPPSRKLGFSSKEGAVSNDVLKSGDNPANGEVGATVKAEGHPPILTLDRDYTPPLDKLSVSAKSLLKEPQTRTFRQFSKIDTFKIDPSIKNNSVRAICPVRGESLSKCTTTTLYDLVSKLGYFATRYEETIEKTALKDPNLAISRKYISKQFKGTLVDSIMKFDLDHPTISESSSDLRYDKKGRLIFDEKISIEKDKKTIENSFDDTNQRMTQSTKSNDILLGVMEVDFANAKAEKPLTVQLAFAGIDGSGILKTIPSIGIDYIPQQLYSYLVKDVEYFNSIKCEKDSLNRLIKCAARDKKMTDYIIVPTRQMDMDITRDGYDVVEVGLTEDYSSDGASNSTSSPSNRFERKMVLDANFRVLETTENYTKDSNTVTTIFKRTYSKYDEPTVLETIVNGVSSSKATWTFMD